MIILCLLIVILITWDRTSYTGARPQLISQQSVITFSFSSEGDAFRNINLYYSHHAGFVQATTQWEISLVQPTCICTYIKVRWLGNRAAQRVGSRMRQAEGDDRVMREGREHRVQWENLSDLNDVYGIIHPQQFDDKLDMGALHSQLPDVT